MTVVQFFSGLIGLVSGFIHYLITVVLSSPVFIIPFSIVFGSGCIALVIRILKR